MTNNTTPQPPTAPTKKRSPLVWVLLGCGVFLIIAGAVTAAVLWWGYHKAKNYVESQTGPGTMKFAELWPDVPRMDGMKQSQQIDMPLGLKVVAKKVMDTMMRGVNNGAEAGHWDWTGFSMSGKTPANVQGFYTAERMEASGWKQEGGCMNMSANMSSQPTFCAFQRQEGEKTTGLLIIAANDEEHKATSIFFIRQESQDGASSAKP
jgi:hypothetical protein